MPRLVWIGDGSEGALSDETRTLLSTGATLYTAEPSDISVEGLPPMQPIPTDGVVPEDSILVLAGNGPRPLDPLNQLVDVVRRLLGPGGCPWDQEQTHESLKKYLLEECYEVIDAIDSGSDGAFREELGDLLLQPLMHAAMAERDHRFSVDEVANEIVLKLVRRHPHVFGSGTASTADEVLRNWDAIKKTEKGEAPRSVLAGVPRAMPSLLRAHEISKRAARSGFEWPDIEAVFDKLHEEEQELKQAIASRDAKQIESEVGDLLFTAVNIARWTGVEPEDALRRMLDRFTSRFLSMEAASDRPLRDLTPEEWEVLWNQAKLNLAQEPGTS